MKIYRKVKVTTLIFGAFLTNACGEVASPRANEKMETEIKQSQTNTYSASSIPEEPKTLLLKPTPQPTPTVVPPPKKTEKCDVVIAKATCSGPRRAWGLCSYDISGATPHCKVDTVMIPKGGGFGMIEYSMVACTCEGSGPKTLGLGTMEYCLQMMKDPNICKEMYRGTPALFCASKVNFNAFFSPCVK